MESNKRKKVGKIGEKESQKEWKKDGKETRK
jgi:hypothetical protein